MITTSNIDFNIENIKIEGVTDFKTDIFPSHFLGLICGKPGSGKTTLLKFILKHPDIFFKKFDYVFIISPSVQEFVSLFLPSDNFHMNLDYDWIKTKIKEVNESKEYINVLFILDDVIAQLHKHQKCEEILSFIFNRRHLLTNGMISILITTQKYRLTPTVIRSNISFIISFKLNKIDWKAIQEEIIYHDGDFLSIINYIFVNPNDFMIYRIDNDTFYKKFDKLNI